MASGKRIAWADPANWASGTVLSGATDLTVAEFATFNVNGGAPEVGSLAGAGLVRIDAGELGFPGSLTAGGNGASTLFTGLMRGNGNFQKNGVGTMTVARELSLSIGQVKIHEGTLCTTVDHAIQADVPVHIFADGLWGLAGTSQAVASLTGSGTVDFSACGSGLGTGGRLGVSHPGGANFYGRLGLVPGVGLFVVGAPRTYLHGEINANLETGLVGEIVIATTEFHSHEVNNQGSLVIDPGFAATLNYGGRIRGGQVWLDSGDFNMTANRVTGEDVDLNLAMASDWSLNGTIQDVDSLHGAGMIRFDPAGRLTIHGNLLDSHFMGDLGAVPGAGLTVIRRGTTGLSGRVMSDLETQWIDPDHPGVLQLLTTQVESKVITTNGRLVLDHGGNWDFQGVFDGGGGVIEQRGGSTVSTIAVNPFAGRLWITGGSFQIGDENNPGTWGPGEIDMDGGDFIIGMNDNILIPNKLLGPSHFIQRGTGLTEVTEAASEFGGRFDIEAGTLKLTGDYPEARAIVRGGATITGAGSIGAGAVGAANPALIVEENGIVQPGNTPGVLTVGSLRLEGGAVLDFELGPVAGPNDRIDSSGNRSQDVRVDPGTLLKITPLDGFDPPEDGGGIYTLINGVELDPVTVAGNLTISQGAPTNNAWVFATSQALGDVALVLVEHNEASWEPGADVDRGELFFGVFDPWQPSVVDTRLVFNLESATGFRDLMRMAAVTDADFTGDKQVFAYNGLPEQREVEAGSSVDGRFSVNFAGADEGFYALVLTIPRSRFSDEEDLSLLLPDDYDSLGDPSGLDLSGATQSGDLVFIWTAEVIPESQALLLLVAGGGAWTRRRRGRA
jgi:hypothetical protein